MSKMFFSVLLFFVVFSRDAQTTVWFEEVKISPAVQESAVINVAGYTSSPAVTLLDQVNVFRDGNLFQLLFFATADTGITLPVLAPFSKNIYVDDMQYGAYTVRCFALNFDLIDSTFFFSPDSSTFLFPSDSLNVADSLFILADTTFVAEYSPSTFVNEREVFQAGIDIVNYPNPFNGSTTFQFSVPHTMPVKLTIYDILGKKVATLVADELSRGYYSYTWDASTFSSGAYFYKLSVGEILKIGRLALLK